MLPRYSLGRILSAIGAPNAESLASEIATCVPKRP